MNHKYFKLCKMRLLIQMKFTNAGAGGTQLSKNILISKITADPSNFKNVTNLPSQKVQKWPILPLCLEITSSHLICLLLFETKSKNSDRHQHSCCCC